MNNVVFGKTMKNVRELFGENYYHTAKFFTEYLLAMEMKKHILMIKPVYLGLSVLKLSKILIYEFWYNYVKPKCGEKTKLCYVDTGSFIE